MAGDSIAGFHFLVVTGERNSWNHAIAVLDTAAELKSLLDTWRREDQANLSPVSTLKGLVFWLGRYMLHNLAFFIRNQASATFQAN